MKTFGVRGCVFIRYRIFLTNSTSSTAPLSLPVPLSPSIFIYLFLSIHLFITHNYFTTHLENAPLKSTNQFACRMIYFHNSITHINVLN